MNNGIKTVKTLATLATSCGGFILGAGMIAAAMYDKKASMGDRIGSLIVGGLLSLASTVPMGDVLLS